MMVSRPVERFASLTVARSRSYARALIIASWNRPRSFSRHALTRIRVAQQLGCLSPTQVQPASPQPPSFRPDLGSLRGRQASSTAAHLISSPTSPGFLTPYPVARCGAYIQQALFAAKDLASSPAQACAILRKAHRSPAQSAASLFETGLARTAAAQPAPVATSVQG